MSSEAGGVRPGADGGVHVRDSEIGAARRLSLRPLTFVGVLVVAIAGAGAGGFFLAGAVQPAVDPTLSLAAHGEAAAYEAVPPNRLARVGYKERLATMAAEKGRLRNELTKAEARHDRALAALRTTELELNAVSGELDRVRDENAAEDGEAVADTEALVAARNKLTDLQLELAAAEAAREGLNQTLATLAETMEQVIAERDAAAERAETLDERMSEIAERQERTLQAIEDAARLSLDGMREMFERTGLDVERILGETREEHSGAGGPFEALADQASGTGEDEADIRVAALMGDLEELNLMRYAAKRLPFGMPVETGRVTSGFGPRRDPLGRGRAMHKGIDFAAPTGTEIFATADGVVTFSGVQRGYGRIVTVRHAFGVETRYAHLNRSRVKVGQRVKRGDHIADMGNTGRSTGTHLHYEIRIDREAVNPVNFLEAQTDVL